MVSWLPANTNGHRIIDWCLNTRPVADDRLAKNSIIRLPGRLLASLDVASVCRVAVAIARAVGNRGRGTVGSGVLVTAEAVPLLLVLRLGTHLNVVRSGVAGQGISGAGSFGVVLVAAPEGTTATVSVVVGGRRTEALLALVVASKQDLEENGDQEEETRGSVSMLGAKP